MGLMDVICPMCGLPAASVMIPCGMRLIGCRCAERNGRYTFAFSWVMSTTDNHDPGDEDRR